MGWFIGQSRAKLAFMVQLFLNLTNMALSAFFVLELGMTSDGVGLAALIAEWSAVQLALALALGMLRRMGARISMARILDRDRLWKTMAMNGDVMIRTLCLVFAFTWFTARGARAGDVVVAANAVLINLFEVSAYLIDGFAYASEALVGQSVGARAARPRFRAAIWLTIDLGHGGGRALLRRHLVRRPCAHRSDDGQPGGARDGARLSALGGDRAGARRHLLPVRRHLHRRHGNPRHAQHDDRVAGRLHAGLVAARSALRQSRPLGRAQHLLRGPRLTFASRMPSLERRAFA